MNDRTIIKQFTIVRFEPNSILLYHQNSHKTYQYLQPSSQCSLHPQIIHKSLIRPIIYNNGLLYPRGVSNLQTELENRRRAHNVIHFKQEEIVNTFIPLLECLMFLHKNGIVHANITPSNILITDEEEIKMKDWMVAQKDNLYYGCKKRSQITEEDDLMAIGLLIAQAATLRKFTKVFQEKDITQLFESLFDLYSKGFIFGLAILLKNKKEKYGHLLGCFNNDQAALGDPELNSFYSSLKKEQEQEKKKVVIITNQNAVPNITLSLKQIYTENQSPPKKSILCTTSKRIKQDQNKKSWNGQIKRKQIEKINKLLQKSNEFSSEVAERKHNEKVLKKISPKPNVTINLSFLQPKKSTTLITSSTRIRTISKNK